MPERGSGKRSRACRASTPSAYDLRAIRSSGWLTSDGMYVVMLFLQNRHDRRVADGSTAASCPFLALYFYSMIEGSIFSSDHDCIMGYHRGRSILSQGAVFVPIDVNPGDATPRRHVRFRLRGRQCHQLTRRCVHRWRAGRGGRAGGGRRGCCFSSACGGGWLALGAPSRGGAVPPVPPSHLLATAVAAVIPSDGSVVDHGVFTVNAMSQHS